jgi:CheY-like chemotaxis protein
MKPPTQPGSSSRERHLVFLVDDDYQLRPVLARCLEHAGFAVQAFPHAQAVLETLDLDGHRPRVLVSDYQMPGMNGLELIARCRKLMPEVITISISGTPELPELSQPRCRPDRLLAKPFLPSELISTIRTLLAENEPGRAGGA